MNITFAVKSDKQEQDNFSEARIFRLYVKKSLNTSGLLFTSREYGLVIYSAESQSFQSDEVTFVLDYALSGRP